MNEQDALKELKRQVSCWESGKEFAYGLEPLKIAAKSLEKQIPKKPEEQETTEKTHYKCKCGYVMLTIYADGYHLGNKPKYCERCGQAIDWEDVD